MKLSLNKDLAPLKAAAIALVDQQAGEVRSRYITVAPGQEMVYLEKRQEAERYIANPSIAPDDILHLTREAALNGITVMDQAEIVLTMARQWKQVSGPIEDMRLSAKKAIDAATTPAEIEAAMPNWKALQ